MGAEAPRGKDLAKHAVSAFRTAVDDDPTISKGRAKKLARRAQKAAAAEKRALHKAAPKSKKKGKKKSHKKKATKKKGKKHVDQNAALTRATRAVRAVAKRQKQARHQLKVITAKLKKAKA